MDWDVSGLDAAARSATGIALLKRGASARLGGMRTILFITTYTGMGGGETSLLTLAEHLDPARYRPHLYVPGDGGLPERWRAHGWPVTVDPFRGASTLFVPALWMRFPIAGRVRALIASAGIAAVHSDYHSLPYALAAARAAHVPLVWTCWGWWFHPRPWQRRFFTRPDHTFASSWAIRDGFLGDPPFMPAERVEVLPPGVDTTRFHPGVDGGVVRAEAGIAPDAPLVAMIARFQDVKGHDVFQAMARRVAADVPDARFLVAGESVHGVGSEHAYKQRILAAHQADPVLRDRLTYLGFRQDAEAVIAAADVVVCASDFESYGMVNLEAMACGRPVVSTRRGGPSETVLDGVTGFLVDPRDDAALAARTIALLRDPALRARMGAAGRQHVAARFSVDGMADRFQTVIDGVLDGVMDGRPRP